ncbi:MAG: DNA cytosine methyltransferase [Ktedonobacteraceae bacterium]
MIAQGGDDIFDLMGNVYLNMIHGRREHIDLRKYKRKLTELTHNQLTKWDAADQTKTTEKAPFQVIDFFSGGGGMSLGFAALSKVFPFFKLIGGCDIDPEALETYQRNFNAPGILADIRLLASDKTMLQKFLTQLNGYDQRRPLIVIGCAPCQGFSSHRKKNWAKEDERNDLVAAFTSLAIQLNPECVIMENVPEILSEKYWSYFQEAKRILTKAGYVVRQSIYNAASFGVPQERFRAVIVATRKNFYLPEPLIEDPALYVTVRQAIGHLPSVLPGQICQEDKFHRSATHRASTIETICAVPENGGSRPKGVGPKCLDKIKGFSDVYGRLYWDKPAITITHYARNPASGRYVHPQQNRGLTMRETALLQSFPTGFEFFGSFDSIFKQIGEAVPPKFSCALAVNTLVELLASPPDEEAEETCIRSITSPVSSSYSSVIAGVKSTREQK